MSVLDSMSERYLEVIADKDAEIERLRAALIRIACYDDKGANERLAATGSYGAFDEPGSVEIAREALNDPATKSPARSEDSQG